MMQQQTHARAIPGRRSVAKAQFVGTVTDFLVADPHRHPRPQAFLVEQSANWCLPTHFHLEHQFQVFVAGSATLGKSPVTTPSVHYASPHSAYGPLNSGAAGVSYFTLRLLSDDGAWYLPEARDKLKLRIPKRQAHGAPSVNLSPEQLTALPAPAQETLIEPEAGGLAAWIIRLPPNTSAAAPPPHALGAGRFYVVTQGALRANGEELPRLSTLFANPDDALDLVSGSGGLEAVIVQYPAEALVSVSRI